eukprot:jgi/Orpsp1_1/1183721/evm.model.c7180000086430.1
MNDYKNYNNANNIRCNYKINRNNLDIQSINKPKIKILNATINSPISCKESRNLTYSNLLKLTSLTNKHEKIKYIKKECSNNSLVNDKNSNYSNKSLKLDKHNKLKLYNKINDTNIMSNSNSLKTYKHIPISLKKAKSNTSLFNRTIKVSLSNPKFPIEKNENQIPTTTETLYKNLHSKKRIIPTISIDNAVSLRRFFFLLNVTFIKASVMAIDYGSQWYKVSLITPKIPLELVLNEESQRKTRSIISIIDDVRMFSNEAISKSTKYPKQTFDFLKLLVGKKINSEEIKFYKSIFDIDIIEDHSRNSILIKSSNETYTVEELIGYQLSKAKLIAENMSSGKVVDKAVITVPRFFNQYERLAMVNAAEIAGIKVLSIMNEDTAAAVNFAMTRNFETQPKYYIFFDMGASSTTITLVSMKSIYNPDEKSKKSPEVQIIDFNYDKTLGGLAFDRELQLLIVEKIKKLIKDVGDIENDYKIMGKILIKARKAKEILSVNTDTTIY